MHLKKIALIVEYEGTRFHGFQLQGELRTVQLELETAIQAFTGESLRVLCASRTDAGVHAQAQVVSLRTAARHEPATFIPALNHFLPEDIAVHAACTLPDDFDIRTQAVARDYEYLVRSQSSPAPLWRERAWVLPYRLNAALMGKVARSLLDEHDFASFAGPMTPDAAKTVKRITRAEFGHRDGCLAFQVTGNSFLHQQVRRMLGTLVEIGRGHLPAETIEQMLTHPVRGTPALVAPPQGLTLTRVHYESGPLTKLGLPNLTAEKSE